MRTTIDIPDDLIEEALRVSSLRSKREAVLAGLHELIRKAEREALRRMAGHVEISLDVRRSRRSKR